MAGDRNARGGREEERKGLVAIGFVFESGDKSMEVTNTSFLELLPIVVIQPICCFKTLFPSPGALRM
jgi:hypothetical protein